MKERVDVQQWASKLRTCSLAKQPEVNIFETYHNSLNFGESFGAGF